MNPEIEQIQFSYVSELRKIKPELLAWWDELVRRDGESAVWARWPTGVSGHPRLLAIFRKYYFQIETYNSTVATPEDDAENIDTELYWGQEDRGKDVNFAHHVGRLILGIPDIAPDLSNVVDGICFIPIGLDAQEELV